MDCRGYFCNNRYVKRGILSALLNGFMYNDVVTNERMIYSIALNRGCRVDVDAIKHVAWPQRQGYLLRCKGKDPGLFKHLSKHQYHPAAHPVHDTSAS